MSTIRHVATGGIISMAVGLSLGLAAFASLSVTLPVALLFGAGGAVGTALVFGAGAAMGNLSAEVDNKSLAAQQCETESARAFSRELDSDRLMSVMLQMQALEAKFNTLQNNVEDLKETIALEQDSIDTTMKNLLRHQVPVSKPETLTGPSRAGFFSNASQTAANDAGSAQAERTRGIRTRTG